MLLLLLLLPVAFPLPPGGHTGEIIGGRAAEPHSRPYMVFVKIETGGNEERRCGGFLIKEDVVMTAAHCNCNLGNISVLLGAHNVDQEEPERQEIWVRRRISHPEYNDETDENDIMLLQLRDKARLTKNVAIIPLPKREVKTGAQCSVAGWGWTSTSENAQPSPTLQEVKLKVMGKETCLHKRFPHFIPSKMLCVGDPQEEKSSFDGDSGGPLVCGREAQGIVSYGTNDGSAPNVFTKVSKYKCWIKKTLRKLKP